MKPARHTSRTPLHVQRLRRARGRRPRATGYRGATGLASRSLPRAARSSPAASARFEITTRIGADSRPSAHRIDERLQVRPAAGDQHAEGVELFSTVGASGAQVDRRLRMTPAIQLATAGGSCECPDARDVLRCRSVLSRRSIAALRRRAIFSGRDYRALLGVLRTGDCCRIQCACSPTALLSNHWHLVVGPAGPRRRLAARALGNRLPTRRAGSVGRPSLATVPFYARAATLIDAREFTGRASSTSAATSSGTHSGAGSGTRAQDWPWCSLSERFRDLRRVPLVSSPFLTSTGGSITSITRDAAPFVSRRDLAPQMPVTVENSPVLQADVADAQAQSAAARARRARRAGRGDENQSDAHVERAEHLRRRRCRRRAGATRTRAAPSSSPGRVRSRSPSGSMRGRFSAMPPPVMCAMPLIQPRVEERPMTGRYDRCVRRSAVADRLAELRHVAVDREPQVLERDLAGQRIPVRVETRRRQRDQHDRRATMRAAVDDPRARDTRPTMNPATSYSPSA